MRVKSERMAIAAIQLVHLRFRGVQLVVHHRCSLGAGLGGCADQFSLAAQQTDFERGFQAQDMLLCLNPADHFFGQQLDLLRS